MLVLGIDRAGTHQRREVMAKDEQTPSKDWRLEEGDDVDERWVLQDSEQQLNNSGISRASTNLSANGSRSNMRSRAAAAYLILPTIVTVALLGVLGFSAISLGPSIKAMVEEIFDHA